MTYDIRSRIYDLPGYVPTIRPTTNVLEEITVRTILQQELEIQYGRKQTIPPFESFAPEYDSLAMAMHAAAKHIADVLPVQFSSDRMRSLRIVAQRVASNAVPKMEYTPLPFDWRVREDDAHDLFSSSSSRAP